MNSETADQSWDSTAINAGMFYTGLFLAAMPFCALLSGGNGFEVVFLLFSPLINETALFLGIGLICHMFSDFYAEHRTRGKWVIFLVVVICLLAGTLLPHLGYIYTCCLFGWTFYLGHVIPQITFELRPVAIGVTWVLLTTACVHGVGQAFWKSRRQNVTRPDLETSSVESLPLSVNSRWPRRWTFSIMACVTLLFVSGLMCTGMLRTMEWLWINRQQF